jgi:acyl-CoA hydrolase
MGELHAFCGYSLNPAWDAAINEALRVTTYCGLGTVRRLVERGGARLIPAQLSQLTSWFAAGTLKCDVVLLQVSPADAEGYHSLGCTVDYVWAAVQRARVVLVEVNSQVPQTRSSCRLHASRIVVALESEVPLPELPNDTPDDVQLAIGQQVARLVPDGAIIQLGIGSFAAAIARALRDHRRLKVRSGMAGDWLPALIASGAIDTGDPEACMVSLAVGTRKLYESLGAGNAVSFAPLADLVSPAGKAADAPFIAINSAIEVDLYGQVNAETVGSRYVGAVSGQPDYFRAARRSPGGLAIIALPATTGKDGRSRVVKRLAGTCVTTAQSDIDFIVTEHGAADVRATTLNERRTLIASLAAPQFRTALTEGEAHVPA